MMRLFRPAILFLLTAISVAARPTLGLLLPPEFDAWLAPIQMRDCQPQAEREQRREQDQRVDDVLKALGVGAGSMVADIGAGQGFYTVRLARAVGDQGKVIAVDISDSALRQLRARVERDGLKNVEIIEGAADDPRLPAASLDAALIVNAYHEMTEYEAMLKKIRAALKPSGRLVILEPISPSRRRAARAQQTREHEIAPELVIGDLRDAGFKISNLEEPFASHSHHGFEWLIVATPMAAERSSMAER
jgi:precorrin-6B methylase 2